MRLTFCALLCLLPSLGCGNSPAAAKSVTGAASSTGATLGSATASGSTASTGSTTHGVSSNSTSSSAAASSSGVASSHGSSTVAASTSGSSGTTGNCVPNGEFATSAAQCCSGQIAAGYCTGPGSSSSGGSGSTVAASSGSTSSSTNGSSGSSSSSSSGGNSGGSTGGICPMNMPDLNTGAGTTTVTGSCSDVATCPKGYQCNAQKRCALNTSDTLQVTLSFDNIEDFDLHVIEPLGDGGTCEIYYGNPGAPPADAGGFNVCTLFPYLCTDAGFIFGAGGGCPAGWLDRDTNAACNDNNMQPDGVNIENVLFQNGVPPPSGTYTVRVDYWQNCDSLTCSDGQDANACNGYPTSHIGVQVRLPTGAIDTYCPVISEWQQGPNDQGANGGQFADSGGPGSGFTIVTFTLP